MHYIRINFIAKEQDVNHLAGKCIRILHGVYHRQKINNIAIAFPEWSCSSPGDSIVFVSPDKDSLQILAEQNYYLKMQELGYFNISNVRQSPSDSDYCLFIRNQRIEKYSPSGLKRILHRSKKRAESRGEIYRPIHQSIDVNWGDVHLIPISSGSSNQEFKLYIERLPKTAQPGDNQIATSYGLSNQSSKQFYVPLSF
ncbi:type I-F CRISPR-associated endoribonuclease Cas6/Csy4 [Planctobacterium marinum]|uniref:type I-F CRISPR-associated endoribonuclease Cas6/Csy4 n=1 Tax=Planctobacterium marinum TaxID=1631968 RepID=UPI0030C71343